MDISEEEFNEQHLKCREKEENNMGLRPIKPKSRTAKKGKAGKVLGSPKKGKAGESKTKWFNKGGRTGKASGGRIGKQFGGGLSRPLGGAGMPARPLGGMRAPVGAMGPRRFGMKHGSKKK